LAAGNRGVQHQGRVVADIGGRDDTRARFEALLVARSPSDASRIAAAPSTTPDDVPDMMHGFELKVGIFLVDQLA
jgi:hypothetical protein